jgi:ribosome maturation protein SDO1
MANTTARVKKAGKNFEIIVDMDNALKFKKGMLKSIEAEGGRIFSDSKKGLAASNSDLMAAFGTNDVNAIAGMIVRQGEVLVTQEHRDEERDRRIKQAVDFIATNAVDQNGRPYTPEKIKTSLEQAHVNIKNAPVESQIREIMESLSKIIPIRLETKKVRITIPAIHTGKAYGIITQYKESERWLNDGSLEVIINVPAGALIDFYDKLNGVTHGSALAEEIKE